MDNKAWLERYLIFFGSIIILAVVTLIGYMAVTQTHPIEATVAPFVQALISIVTLIVGYYWGSSSSSASKDKTLSDLASGGPAAPVQPMGSPAPVAPQPDAFPTPSAPPPGAEVSPASSKPGWNPRPES